MPNFETFTKRMVPLVKQPYVTIQRRGTISLNASAHDQLGAPDAVELLYDKEEQIVGFRAVPKEAEHAYGLRAAGKTYIVSGTAFTKYYKIDTSVSKRWPAHMDGDVLCVDLKAEGTEVTSNRTAAEDSSAE